MDEIKAIKDGLSDLAKVFGSARVEKAEYANKLRELGFDDENLTNNALIVASVFANAVQGDMKAVEKWQELTGTVIEDEKESDEIADILSERRDDGRPGAVRKNRAGRGDV